RVALGFERKDAQWVQRKDAAEQGTPPAKIASNVIEAMAVEYQNLANEHVKTLIALGEGALRAESTEVASSCAKFVVFYDAQNDWANRLLGKEKTDDIWLP